MRRYIEAEDVEKRIDIVMGSEPKAWDEKALRELKMYVVHAVPTADVVEVVRCKDCKHSEHWYRDKRRCFLWHEEGIDVFDDGFCSYGERENEEDIDESVIAEWICLGHRIGLLKHPYSIDYKCSNCGYEEYTLLSSPPERCPKCRAYMKGKREEQCQK